LIDDFTRDCLTLLVDTSLTSLRVARELDRVAELRRYPGIVVSDTGTELTSNAILTWQQQHGVEWHHIAPGKPMRKGLSKASTAACAMSASTNTCSPTSRRRARSSKNGGSKHKPTALEPPRAHTN
jgi:putative transposase